MNIIWEDGRLIICEKPVQVLSQPAPEGGEDMLTLLSQYRVQKGELAQVFPIHRLDCGVGGLMVFAKDSKTAGQLSTLIQQKDFCKEYLAVIHGTPELPQGVFADLLFRDATRNKTYVVKRQRRGVREAELEYTLLETVDWQGSPLSLVRVHLLTGRTHQVRVQFASRKLPLFGDGRYGARDGGGDLALWSTRLAFRHPSGTGEVDVSLLPPLQFPWTLFSQHREE